MRLSGCLECGRDARAGTDGQIAFCDPQAPHHAFGEHRTLFSGMDSIGSKPTDRHNFWIKSPSNRLGIGR
jgi:hypothetical protein